MGKPPAPQKIILGPSGPEISQLGIGTWAWGDQFVWGYGRGGYTDSDLRTAFEVSVNAGITWFDTAEVYGLGRSETLLGDFIKRAQADVLIATKFFPFPWRQRRESVPRVLKASLKRLGVDRVGLYQIHWPSPATSIETLMHGLADVVEMGLAETVGVSNYNAKQTRMAHDILASRGIPLSSNQIQYSLIKRDPELNGLLALCKELAITVIAYSPIGMGMLSGRYSPENPPSGTRARRYNQNFLEKLGPMVTLLTEIGEAHGGKTPAQVAINWTIAKGTVPIPGAKNARQAEQNAASAGWELSKDEIAALDKASEAFILFDD